MSASADPGLERFIGRIATTDTVLFGGPPYCNYSVTLKDVVLDVTLHPVNGLVTMVVADTMVETTVGTCSYPPQAMNRQGFEFRAAPQPAGANETFAPKLDGITTNRPNTEAITTVTRVKDTRLTATVRWHRTDIGPPLDWTVMTSPILDRVLCEAGDIYCLGGSVVGAEYGCTDGIHFHEFKRCNSGCGPTQLPPAPHEDEHCN